MKVKTILIYLFVFTLIIFVSYYYLSDYPMVSTRLDVQETSCDKEDLISKANCWHEELKEFFVYNESNYKKSLTLEQLKTEGGVCWHYSNWYAKKAKQEGFSAKEIILDTGEYTHQIAIVSDDRVYCILDQTFKPVCHKLSLGGSE